MSVADFEPDQRFLDLGDGVRISNDDDGQLVTNAVKADEFTNIGQDIEGLLYLGYLTTDLEFYGHTFTLKTLTRGERLAVAQFAAEYEESLGLALAMETATLAISLILVDGRALSIPLGDEDRSPMMTLRRNWQIVHRWFDPVLDVLYAEYRLLQQRMNNAFTELQGNSTASRRTT